MPSLKVPKDTDWTWTKVVKVGEPLTSSCKLPRSFARI
jgi:hypothetical protein